MKEQELKELEKRATKIRRVGKRLQARAYRILDLVELGLIREPKRRWSGDICPKCGKPFKPGYTEVDTSIYYFSCPCGYEYAFQEDLEGLGM